jgi:hypothetical protein
MQKIMQGIALTILALFVSANITLAQKEKTMDKEHGGKPLTIQLSGGAEVPGPGDADGSGTANLTLNHGQGQVCYDITVKDIQTPTAAHIHVGALGKSGGVKVPLTANNGTWKGCVNADKSLIKDLMDNPGNYYVNVHNAEFPNGAIRGQLGK